MVISYKLLIATALILMPISCFAISPAGDYRCMIKKADAILVVSDRKTDRYIMDDYIGPLYMTTLRIEKEFKGNVTSGGKRVAEFPILVRRDASDSAGKELLSGKPYLAFIRYSSSGGPQIMRESAGVIPYDGEIEIYGKNLNDSAIELFIKRSMDKKLDCSLDDQFGY